MLSKNILIYRFLCTRWVLFTMVPRNSNRPILRDMLASGSSGIPGFGAKNIAINQFHSAASGVPNWYPGHLIQ